MAFFRFLYNLIFPFVIIALLPGFLLRMIKRGKYRHKFGQRFGIYSPRVREKIRKGQWTWVHAVSVGEVLIALKLIREMKKRHPHLQIVLSTTTSTGFALANNEKSDWLEPIYNPLDFFPIVRAAVRLIRPYQLILIEAEVWPNLIAEVKALGSRVALVNARLSQRSERRYRFVRPFASLIFNQLDLLCVTDTSDAARWKALGVGVDKIHHTGSIKFDDAEPARHVQKDFIPVLSDLGVDAKAPILLAGSTHAGEEKLLGEIFVRLQKDFPDLFFIVVPRHVERWREVHDELTALGLCVTLRVGKKTAPAKANVLLINTTGELRDWYACATVVFIGKSLTSHGGQNPAEALSAGKPVVFGPYMENFKTLVAQLLRDTGAIQVKNSASLEAALHALLSNKQKRDILAIQGSKCLALHHGATIRTAVLLEELSNIPKGYN